MLIQQKYELLLQKSYDKILYFYCAINNSFAFLAHRNSGKDLFGHCSRNGKIVFEMVFDDPVDSLAMVSDNEAIVLMTRKNCITVIDLTTHETMNIPFNFMFQGSDQCFIDTFNVTRLFCIKEKGLMNDNRLRLSYFAYPLTTKSRPVSVYQSQENAWTPEYQIQKGDQKGLMLWWKPKFSKEVSIRGFRVSQISGTVKKYKGQLVSFETDLIQVGILAKVLISIGKCWQMNENHLMLAGLVNIRDTLKSDEQSPIQMVLDKRKKIVRPLKFKQPKEVSECQIDQINLGICSIFRTFAFENGRASPSPVFVINNLNEQLLAQESWECSHLFKFFVSGYEPDTLIECQYDNSDVSEIVITKKTLMNSRMVALFMLMELDEDLDDDLLQQTVKFLPLYGIDQE